MSSYHPSHRHRRTRLGLTIVVGWLLFLGVLSYNRQGIVDAWRLHDYQPPAAIGQIAVTDTMTSQARKIFYVNQPTVTSKAPFAAACPSGTEQTVVLGCYQGNQDGIYVLDVSDTRLNGVEQVTAAHEMLHAAYDRLSSRQKAQLNAQLQDFYDHGLTDPVVKAQIADYKQSEPHDVVNEMHSLFGTEVAQLPAPLEAHYAQYFSDRAKVVQMYNAYQAEFTTRQAAIKADDQQLKSMKAQIETVEKSLDTQDQSIETHRRQLDSLRSSGSITAYNAAVPGFNAAVDSYNASATALRQQIVAYNNLVDARNAIASETQTLVNEISNKVPDAGQ